MPRCAEDGRRERENMDYVKEIKKSLERLAYYERLSAQKQEAWDADPMDSDREEAADQAYELEFNKYVFAAHLISRFAGIGEKEARTMISKDRAKLMRILSA